MNSQREIRFQIYVRGIGTCPGYQDENLFDTEAQALGKRKDCQIGKRLTNDLLFSISYPARFWIYRKRRVNFMPILNHKDAYPLVRYLKFWGKKFTYHWTIRREAAVSSYARFQQDQQQKRDRAVAVVPENL